MSYGDKAEVAKARAKVLRTGLGHAVRHPLEGAFAYTPAQVFIVREALHGAADKKKSKGGG